MSTKKILVLGHRGMLGSTVCEYLSKAGHAIETLSLRWPDQEFRKRVIDSSADWIINAIGAIPQRGFAAEDFRSINFELPSFLSSLERPLLHPTSDCEFSGTRPFPSRYSVHDTQDACDAYGLSKAHSSIELLKHPSAIVIRASIIGLETTSTYSLLGWFLSDTTPANGFTNHYWNGITTLEWAKIAHRVVCGELKDPRFIQPATESRSKYELLRSVVELFNHPRQLTPTVAERTVNRLLEPNIETTPIVRQLQELRDSRS